MTVRDVEAIIKASRFVSHGTTPYGGSYANCVCPKARCGGVAEGTERDDCPEHSRCPAQLWHWDAECPVPTVLAAAQALVRRGLAVFPLPPGGRVPRPGWQQTATLDETVLPAVFAGGRNVGVGCRASRAVALDLDTHSDAGSNGAASLRALLNAHGGDWPDTFTVATPSGGLHLYFQVPADCTIGSASGDRSPLGPGIDVRGPGLRSGGYLVGPGSLVGGRPYLVEHDVPVAPLPTWLERLLRPGDRSMG